MFFFNSNNSFSNYLSLFVMAKVRQTFAIVNSRQEPHEITLNKNSI